MKADVAEKIDATDGPVATTAQVTEAIENLSSVDWNRLESVAKMYAGDRVIRDVGMEHTDLLQDAFSKSLALVRHWPYERVDFVRFIAEVMRSDSSNAARLRENSIEDNESALEIANPDGNGRMLEYPEPSPQPDTLIENQELPKWMIKLEEEFRSDSVASGILEAWSEGYGRSEICTLNELNRADFDAVSKRIRRRARKLREGGDDRD